MNNFCTNCGTELKQDVKFCGICGEAIKAGSGKDTDYTALIERAIQGDSDAFHEIYENRFNDLYYMALSMLRNPHDAEDVTQTTMVQAWNNISKLQSPYAFKGWLTKILRNNCMDLIRKKKPVLQTDEDMSFEETLYEDNIEFLPADIMDKKETQRLVRQIVDNLPDSQRETIILHYFDLMPLIEIAATMGVSEGTVKSRLYYGRMAIKEGVEEHERKGVKLYSITGLPFLVSILRDGALDTAFSPTAIDALWQVACSSMDISMGIGVGTGTSIASTTSSGTTIGAVATKSTGVLGKFMALSLPIKTAIICGILTAGVLGGVVLSSGIGNLFNDSDTDDEIPYAEEQINSGNGLNEDETPDTSIDPVLNEEDDTIIDDSWRDVYAEFLRNPELNDSYNKFFLYKFDDDCIPLLFVLYGTRFVVVYEYIDSVEIMTQVDNGEMFISTNPSQPGFFSIYYNWYLDYYSLIDCQKLSTRIYEYEDEIDNYELYEDWLNSVYIPYYEVTETNIQIYIYDNKLEDNFVEVDWKQIYFDEIKLALANSQSADHSIPFDLRKHPFDMNYIMIADLNFDGVPELILFGDGVSASETMWIYTIIQDKTELMFIGFGNPSYDWGDYDDYYDLQLLRNISDGSLAYRINSGNGGYNHAGGSIYLTNKSTQMNKNFDNSTKMLTYSWEYDDSYEFIDDSSLWEYTINQQQVSEIEYLFAINKIVSGYTKIKYTPAVISLWNDNFSDRSILALFDSYISENKININSILETIEETIIRLDRQYIQRDDLLHFTLDDLGYLRNGIFALSGRIFNTEKYRNFFNEQSWYTGTTTSDNEVRNKFNDYQIKNLDIILTRENEIR